MVMIVTKESLADMLMRYIKREITLPALVSWAEDMVNEGDFEDEAFDIIKDILLRLGLADVREFGLTWDECRDHLRRLGYDVKVELVEA
jgi:hypothetical protein